MNALLFYLTEVEDVPRNFIVDGYYAGTSLLPQEYLYNRIGKTAFRKFFADWCAHNAAFFDYAPRRHYEQALMNLKDPTFRDLDLNDINPYVLSLNDTGTDGLFIEPPDSLNPMAWSYNVYRIEITTDAEYTFTLEGDEFSSDGQEAHFAGRIAIANENDLSKNHFVSMEMMTELDGSVTVSVSATETTELFFVVASVPEHFSGLQTYSYRVKIDRTVHA